MSKRSFLYRAHPWHGVAVGPDPPALVTAYIELTPEDTIKYELDKASGILKVDRPQLYSNVCPAFYGFIPRTYCAEHLGALASERTGRPGIIGDGDPLDICVLTDKRITRSNILIDAIPIGGLRMIDANKADDKIIAVMKGDQAYDLVRDISDVRPTQLDRLRHYFLTYKQSPDASERVVEIAEVYDRDAAHEAIRRSQLDYEAHFGSAHAQS